MGTPTLMNFKMIFARRVQNKSVGPLFKMIKNFKMVTAENKPGVGPSECGAPV